MTTDVVLKDVERNGLSGALIMAKTTRTNAKRVQPFHCFDGRVVSHRVVDLIKSLILSKRGKRWLGLEDNLRRRRVETKILKQRTFNRDVSIYYATMYNHYSITMSIIAVIIILRIIIIIPHVMCHIRSLR